jgi:hypothetical protein
MLLQDGAEIITTTLEGTGSPVSEPRMEATLSLANAMRLDNTVAFQIADKQVHRIPHGQQQRMEFSSSQWTAACDTALI